MDYCHCGRLLHYNDKTLEKLVKDVITDVGDEYVNVTCKGRMWRWRYFEI